MTSNPRRDAGQAGSLPHQSVQAGDVSHRPEPAGSLPDVDWRLREAFEPEAQAVARVTAGALSATAACGRPRRLAQRLAWAGGAVLAAALGAAVYWRAASSPAAGQAPADLLSGSFTGDVLVLSEPDGSVSVSGPGTRDDRPPEGFGIVLVEGDAK
jgi:hypothetical protein